MGNIQLLDKNTINKIAAGEVVDRPSSIVKELLENSIDAGATLITVEIKDGGTSLIRITDNGCGIKAEDIRAAFLRHSTSKIRSAEDLINVTSLGFRGEALSSIAAVCQIELITKSDDEAVGSRYRIEGGKEISFEEIGAPQGTTILARNIFYNTPARRKFLKSSAAEAGYIADIVEKIAIATPHVSINFINNGKNTVHTSGNSNLKDIIYSLYGRDIASNLIEISKENDFMSISGYIGKPVISKGNRSFENYFVNGRYVKSVIFSKAIEDAYKTYMMQHKYPFTALYLKINQDLLDVNVHPAKMELRFRNSEDIYPFIYNAVSNGLKHREFIPEATIGKDEKTKEKPTFDINKIPEPFETNRIQNVDNEPRDADCGNEFDKSDKACAVYSDHVAETETYSNEKKQENEETSVTQLDLFESDVLTKDARPQHKLIGQVFDTYWIIEYQDKMFIIDQHAAHEKILYEETVKRLKNEEIILQNLNPPIILSLSLTEEALLNKYSAEFKSFGFEIEHFGGREYAVRAVPYQFISVDSNELLKDILDNLSQDAHSFNSELIKDKIASISCKAAVKGNSTLSFNEADEMIDRLLSLDNPYQCPHGRPTIISISKYEMEKKFKRVL